MIQTIFFILFDTATKFFLSPKLNSTFANKLDQSCRFCEM